MAKKDDEWLVIHLITAEKIGTEKGGMGRRRLHRSRLRDLHHPGHPWLVGPLNRPRQSGESQRRRTKSAATSSCRKPEPPTDWSRG